MNDNLEDRSKNAVSFGLIKNASLRILERMKVYTANPDQPSNKALYINKKDFENYPICKYELHDRCDENNCEQNNDILQVVPYVCVFNNKNELLSYLKPSEKIKNSIGFTGYIEEMPDFSNIVFNEDSLPEEEYQFNYVLAVYEVVAYTAVKKIYEELNVLLDEDQIESLIESMFIRETITGEPALDIIYDENDDSTRNQIGVIGFIGVDHFAPSVEAHKLEWVDVTTLKLSVMLSSVLSEHLIKRNYEIWSKIVINNRF